MRLWALALVPAAAAVLVGCGTSLHPTGANASGTVSPAAPAPATSSSAARLPGYLAIANNGAVFLQWQRQGATVSGKRSESYFEQSNPTQLQAQADNFTGTVTGSQVSITFDSGETWSGTIAGSTLTLSYTASDGSLQTLDFHPANAAQYNAAVARTKATVGGAVTQQQQQQATANAQQQVDSDATNLSDDVQSLQSASASLADDSYAGDLSSIRNDVQTVAGDLQTVRSDTSDVACNDAGVAANDAGVAANDEGVLHNDAQVFSNDAQSVLGDIAAIHADQQKLANDNSAVPGYSSSNAPSSADVTVAVRSGQAAVAKERQATTAAEGQAAQLVAQARGIAAQAHAAGCG